MKNNPFISLLILLMSVALPNYVWAKDPILKPLKASTANPNYFTDGKKAVYLTGSHTWNTLQDWGTGDMIQPLDFSAFVNFLVQHHHNFTLLWVTELPKFCGLPTTATAPKDIVVSPFPWLRTGPGKASDGKPKFDLTMFNQAYFDRLRSRVSQLNKAGIYAGVYLFSGEWILRYRCPQDGYPFTGLNNINGVDDQGTMSSVTMTAPNQIIAIQDVYVKKLIETLNDLPNVLWIVSQEAPPDSKWWNNHLISLVRSIEKKKPFQHPIGYGVQGDNKDSVIVNSDADWIAPASRISPTRTIGTGNPARKININDSDHSYWEIWNDPPQKNRNYFWINFTQGNQTIFMDPYLVDYPRQDRNHPLAPQHRIGSAPDPRWEMVINTMGYIRGYAEKMNLLAMFPMSDLSSTGHVLASKKELLIYSASEGEFTVDLSGMKQDFSVEWMNPATGEISHQERIKGGQIIRFNPPFRGDAVLYLK
jgi:hypothetical protein